MFTLERCGWCGDLATHGPEESAMGDYLCDKHFAAMEAPDER